MSASAARDCSPSRLLSAMTRLFSSFVIPLYWFHDIETSGFSKGGTRHVASSSLACFLSFHLSRSSTGMRRHRAAPDLELPYRTSLEWLNGWNLESCRNMKHMLLQLWSHRARSSCTGANTVPIPLILLVSGTFTFSEPIHCKSAANVECCSLQSLRSRCQKVAQNHFASRIVMKSTVLYFIRSPY